MFLESKPSASRNWARSPTPTDRVLPALPFLGPDWAFFSRGSDRRSAIMAKLREMTCKAEVSGARSGACGPDPASGVVVGLPLVRVLAELFGMLLSLSGCARECGQLLGCSIGHFAWVGEQAALSHAWSLGARQVAPHYELLEAVWHIVSLEAAREGAQVDPWEVLTPADHPVWVRGQRLTRSRCYPMLLWTGSARPPLSRIAAIG